MSIIRTRHIWILLIQLLTFLLPIHGHEVYVSNKSATISSRELTHSEIQYTDFTDYLLGGSLMLKNGCIDKLQFEGGYCQAAKYSATQDNFTFFYYDQDHLGSIRQVRIVMSQGKGPILQKMNYYPFGAQFCDGSASSSDVQSHKYNGKELDQMHGLNTYDHGARQYNPVTARWDRMDPLAEKYYPYSPYTYCMDNPVNSIDPDGRSVWTKGAKLVWKVGKQVAKNGLSALKEVSTYTSAFTEVKEDFNTLTDANASTTDRVVAGINLASEALPVSVSDGKAAVNYIRRFSSRVARRKVMREQGIPTSQQPKSQSKNESGREYTYETSGPYGTTDFKSVQQQTKDRSHDEPHWEAGSVKTDNGKPEMNRYGRPKLKSSKSKVEYE